MSNIKPITTEEEKKEALNEIETFKEGIEFDVKEIEAISKRMEEKSRWIFEATLKVKSYEKRNLEPNE